MKMFRYTLGFDGPKEIDLTGDPVAFAECPRVIGAEFWAEHHEDVTPRSRMFQVFGTGKDIQDGAKYWGTAPRTAEGYVYHLYEIPTPDRPMPAFFSGWRL